MSLQQFPTELILKILLCMPSRTLAAMQRTCKTFYALTDPILYRELDFSIETLAGASLVLPTDPICLLLRSLQKRPQIGRLIRAISLGRKKLMETITMPRPRGEIIYVLNRLLNHCTQLESFCMPAQLAQEVSENDLWYTTKEGNDPLSNSHRLQSLKHIDLTTADGIEWAYFTGRHTKGISSLFYLPKVEFIGIELLEGMSFKIEDFDGLNATRLTSLHISKGRLTTQAIGRIVSGTPKLSSLQLDLVWDFNLLPRGGVPRDPGFLDCMLLGQARPGHASDGSPLQKPSLLEDLSIAIDFDSQWSGVPLPDCDIGLGGYEVLTNRWGIKGSIGSLKQFQHLQSLEIPIIVLFGWYDRDMSLRELLPSSLKRLRLRLDCSGVKQWEWDWEKSNLKRILTKYGQGGPLESIHFVPGYNSTKGSKAYPTEFFLD